MKLSNRKRRSIGETLRASLGADTNQKAPPTKADGYVYLIVSESQQAAKIGFAKSLEARLRQLQTGNPHRLKVEFAIPSQSDTEYRLHRLFAPKRIEREWFSDVEQLEEFFCELETEYADNQLQEMFNDGTCPNLRPSDIDAVDAPPI